MGQMEVEDKRGNSNWSLDLLKFGDKASASDAWVNSVSTVSIFSPKVFFLFVETYLVFFYICLLFNNW